MGYMLRKGLSFCETGDRLLFLDVDRDRYFCMTEQGEHGFRRLVAGERLSRADEAVLQGMASNGIIVTSACAARPAACRPPPMAVRSLVDDETPARPVAVAAALVRLTRGVLALRMLSLRTSLRRLERRKARLRPRPGNARDALIDVAAAFRRSGLILPPLDLCLPRSIAAAHALVSSGVTPELVIGVRLYPFAAHCWTQSDGLLVNESVDQVRNFTPILVV